jgi:hypothetical protein
MTGRAAGRSLIDSGWMHANEGDISELTTALDLTRQARAGESLGQHREAAGRRIGEIEHRVPIGVTEVGP